LDQVDRLQVHRKLEAQEKIVHLVRFLLQEVVLVLVPQVVLVQLVDLVVVE
jgi:hypothetical protein